MHQIPRSTMEIDYVGKPASSCAMGDELIRGREVRLQVLTGPWASTEMPLHPGQPVRVGRGPECDLVIVDPSLSRSHFAVKLADDQSQCTIRDLGSTNGTQLDGERVQYARVEPGTLIRAGMTAFRISLSQPAHSDDNRS